MKFCTKCGHELVDEAVVCTNCGCATGTPAPASITKQEEDTVSVGLCVLAFFIPLFGIIYWPIKHKETPKRAKAVGITAIVSWVLGFLFGLILSVTAASVFSSLLYTL